MRSNFFHLPTFKKKIICLAPLKSRYVVSIFLSVAWTHRLAAWPPCVPHFSAQPLRFFALFMCRTTSFIHSFTDASAWILKWIWMAQEENKTLLEEHESICRFYRNGNTKSFCDDGNGTRCLSICEPRLQIVYSATSWTQNKFKVFSEFVVTADILIFASHMMPSGWDRLVLMEGTK